VVIVVDYRSEVLVIVAILIIIIMDK
jgi:hypothetical protein